jgi:dethiobiotin synthetase
MPASPHLAAAVDGVCLDPCRLVPPATARPLIIEGAGGLMVPLTEYSLYIDVFARWGAPVVLCARTTLGTINHTLLSIEALRHRGIPILGIAFIGEEHAANRRIIAKLCGVPILGRLPWFDPLTPAALKAGFESVFRRSDFAPAGAAI